eukprot:2920765-Heterocapsa_arctica.AAC.1
MELKLDGMREKLKNDRSQRLRNWVENSWGHKKKHIYKWIRGKRGNGPLIVSNGGSAQIHNIMKLAEETWGGLWAVEAEELPKFSKQKMALITEDEVRRVVNNLADGKAKGVDGWSPAELRALSRTHIKGLTPILNKVEQSERWPSGLRPIIALIAKEGAENEGQLRRIAVLPYVYRVWMAVKSKVRQWAIKLNDGRFTLPETLVWEIAARGELAKIRGKHFSAACIDCSKCYERVDHKSAATAAVATGCKSTIVALSFDMYKTPRIVQVH